MFGRQVSRAYGKLAHGPTRRRPRSVVRQVASVVWEVRSSPATVTPGFAMCFFIAEALACCKMR